MQPGGWAGTSSEHLWVVLKVEGRCLVARCSLLPSLKPEQVLRLSA